MTIPLKAIDDIIIAGFLLSFIPKISPNKENTNPGIIVNIPRIANINDIKQKK